MSQAREILCVPSKRDSLCFKHKRFIVFQAKEICCVPSKRSSLCFKQERSFLCFKHKKFTVFQTQEFLVFPTEQSLCSQQKNKKSESQFWPKIMKKNPYRPLTPSSKSHTELNLSSSGVIFRARRAGNAQKCVAPPKRLVVDSTPKFFENKSQKKKSAPKNETSGIVRNAFSPSFAGVRGLFEG